MIRICGMVLLVLSVSGIGWMRASELRQRPRALRGMIEVLSLLRDDIAARAMPLSDALAHVGGVSGGNSGEFLISTAYKLQHSDRIFREIWESEVQTLPFLSREDRGTISQLGKHLGVVDAVSQERAMDTCLHALERAEQEALSRAGQFGRLYAGLGMTIGTMLAVVLY